MCSWSWELSFVDLYRQETIGVFQVIAGDGSRRRYYRISLMFNQTHFGGSKQSGAGRRGDIYALRAFTEPKTVMINMDY
jgi:hypothetical protein